ncbi:uncharacterized protein LOC131803479 [Musca domestica]|uniref:Uncharacterized protein LOC131803479 n=1 Tax=Musca domestica TaxID=7370 RepID=A0ABM3V4W6_MUSDO|nr:uncharacterized protein LOC131803479 [Musca domestica]
MVGQHKRRFNAPIIDNVAIVIVGDEIHHRLSKLETYKSFNSKNYYTYTLMIRRNEKNHLLKFRRLFQQYVVVMYVC